MFIVCYALLLFVKGAGGTRDLRGHRTPEPSSLIYRSPCPSPYGQCLSNHMNTTELGLDKAATTIFGFLCSGLTVVTSSYHGLLWSTYLNKTTLLAPEGLFSEKFRYCAYVCGWPTGKVPTFTRIQYVPSKSASHVLSTY